MATSRNLNLRVIGAQAGPPSPGAPSVFGFQVSITSSFLSVARYQGPLLLS